MSGKSFWALRRKRTGTFEPTLYKSEAAAKAKADQMGMFDVVPLFSAAPVREEGGAVEAAFKIATDLHHAYEQLIYGLPKYLEAENLTDEENMIREAWITLDVTAHRIAALATREEAPAGAEEVREAIVTTISFLNRDQGTDRLNDTVTALIPKLVRADAILRGAV